MNPLNEIEEFNLLTEFLSAFEPGVEARGAELSDTEQALLSRIADGSSTEADRDSALPLLAGNTSALEFLAVHLNGDA